MPEVSAQGIGSLVDAAHRDGRDRLLEHEVYALLHRSGIEPPAHHVVRPGDPFRASMIEPITTDRVVLKIVSPDVVHKSDEHGVVLCANDATAVEREAARLLERHAHRERVDGVLIAECVERDAAGGLGTELLVGVRGTREFGPVLAAGLGGTATEHLAETLRPGRAIATAPIDGLTADAFFDLFTRTLAYETLAGLVRGTNRVVEDDELRRCFGAFIDLAGRLCGVRAEGPSLAELEVNPFAVRDGRLVPLDGRARLGAATRRPPPRPPARIRDLLEPKTIAVLGVSATNARSFGRIILGNVINAGFDPDAVTVIKDGADRIDGVACVPSIDALPDPVDLLVVAAGADQLPAVIDACVDSGKVRSAVLIPGGAGETEGSEPIARALEHAVGRARELDSGPVFLGPNSMGLQSRPARFDTFFIPTDKLAKRWDAPHRGVALISQSGAFIVRTMSAFESLDPAISVSVGNQADVTLGDLVRSIGQRPDIHTIGVYAEGFKDLDGLDLCEAFRTARDAGKAVVFYKGGRTPAGRDAAAGHTASLAGDYEVCRDAAARSGALVAEDFTAFSELLETAVTTHGFPARGVRLGAITNAGCESVSMGDQAGADSAPVVLPALPESTRARLGDVLARHGLSGLVTPRNPLDLTPMARDAAYLDATRALLEDNAFDAVIVSCIPATPAIASVGAELDGGSPLAEGLAALRDEFRKPTVAVVDAGPRYERFVAALRDAGFAVLRSADDAARVLARTLAARARRAG